MAKFHCPFLNDDAVVDVVLFQFGERPQPTDGLLNFGGM